MTKIDFVFNNRYWQYKSHNYILYIQQGREIDHVKYQCGKYLKDPNKSRGKNNNVWDIKIQLLGLID